MPCKKGMTHYSRSVKEQAVKMHLEEGMTNPEIMKTLGIVDERRVRKWCETYREYGVVDSPSSKPKAGHENMKGHPRKKLLICGWKLSCYEILPPRRQGGEERTPLSRNIPV